MLDEKMSFGAGGEAENTAMSLSSPSNLSGGGDGIGAVGDARGMDVFSPPNLSADRCGAICNGIWPGSHNSQCLPLLDILVSSILPLSTGSDM